MSNDGQGEEASSERLEAELSQDLQPKSTLHSERNTLMPGTPHVADDGRTDPAEQPQAYFGDSDGKMSSEEAMASRKPSGEENSEDRDNIMEADRNGRSDNEAESRSNSGQDRAAFEADISSERPSQTLAVENTAPASADAHVEDDTEAPASAGVHVEDDVAAPASADARIEDDLAAPTSADARIEDDVAAPTSGDARIEVDVAAPTSAVGHVEDDLAASGSADTHDQDRVDVEAGVDQRKENPDPSPINSECVDEVQLNRDVEHVEVDTAEKVTGPADGDAGTSSPAVDARQAPSKDSVSAPPSLSIESQAQGAPVSVEDRPTKRARVEEQGTSVGASSLKRIRVAEEPRRQTLVFSPATTRMQEVSRYTGPMPSQLTSDKPSVSQLIDDDQLFETWALEENVDPSQVRQRRASSRLKGRKSSSKDDKNTLSNRRQPVLHFVEYDPRIWQAHEGRLEHIKAETTGRPALLEMIEPLGIPLPPPPEPEPESPEDSARRPKRSQEVAGRTRSQRPKDGEHNAEIRIGSKYQAILPDCEPLAYANPAASDVHGDIIWDAKKAEEAAKKADIPGFLSKGKELNTKMKLLEALHKSNYVTEDGLKDFYQWFHNRDGPEISIEVTSDELSALESRFRVQTKKQKEFFKISKELGYRLETVLVQYYRWKSKSKEEYSNLKQSRKVESKYCEICDDGGFLVVCELCRKGYHLKCLQPPLKKEPAGEWYCMWCLSHSPARANRVPRGHRLDTSPPLSMDKSVGCDLNGSVGGSRAQLTASQRDALMKIHKEFSPNKKATDNTKNSGTDAQVRGARGSSGYTGASAMSGYGGPTWGRQAPLAHQGPPHALHSSPNGAPSGHMPPQPRGAGAGPYGSQPPGLPSAPPVVAWASNHRREGEYLYYRVFLPWTSDGLLIKVATFESGNGTCFLGYGKRKNGEDGPAERAKVFQAVGDQIAEVEGRRCLDLPFEEVARLLRHRSPSQNMKALTMRHRLPKSAAGDGALRMDVTGRNGGTQQVAYREDVSAGIIAELPGVKGKRDGTPSSVVDLTHSPITSGSAIKKSLAPVEGAFHRFLSSRGIADPQDFLNKSSAEIARAWAAEMSIDPEDARDFVGAMKFGVRYNKQASIAGNST